MTATSSRCVGDAIEQANFFPKVNLNYAENLLRSELGDARLAITTRDAAGRSEKVTRGVSDAVCVRRSRNSPISSRQAIARWPLARSDIAMAVTTLAVTSLGATMSTAPLDMGVVSIVARFSPLSPTALVCHLRDVDSDRLRGVVRGLPTLRTLIALDDGEPPESALEIVRLSFHEVPETPWRRFPFNHPLFILFSSGTTGAPKCIVHGAGVLLLEHVKEHRLHADLGPGDKLFFFHTSCAWMMWNWQLSALTYAEIVLYSGTVRARRAVVERRRRGKVTGLRDQPGVFADVPRRQDRPHRSRATVPVMSTGSVLHDHLFTAG